MGLKANELRIGNKIFFIICDKENSNLDEKKEITVDISDFEFIRDNNSLFEGIPLTEELILKYGKNSIFSNGYSYRITKLGRVEILLGVAIITLIDYLHEFQNLNFALLSCDIEEYQPLY